MTLWLSPKPQGPAVQACCAWSPPRNGTPRNLPVPTTLCDLMASSDGIDLPFCVQTARSGSSTGLRRSVTEGSASGGGVRRAVVGAAGAAISTSMTFPTMPMDHHSGGQSFNALALASACPVVTGRRWASGPVRTVSGRSSIMMSQDVMLDTAGLGPGSMDLAVELEMLSAGSAKPHASDAWHMPTQAPQVGGGCRAQAERTELGLAGER